MRPVNCVIKWITILIVYSVNGQQYEPLAIANQPFPLITRTSTDNINEHYTNLSKNMLNLRNKKPNSNRNVINVPNNRVGSNVYNKSLSLSTSKVKPQHSPPSESTRQSATINHGEVAESDDGSATSSADSPAANDYDYRGNDLPDWVPPPPPPPPVSLPPPPSGSSSSFSSSLLSSAPSSLQLGSFPGRIQSYPLPTHTNPFHVLPRHGPFAPRPFEHGAGQRDEFTLFLVILTIAGFFGLIISMFMPFTLLLQSQQQSLGQPIGGLQSVYPIQPGLVQPAQLGTGAVVAGGKRRRRKRNDSPTVISIMASLHDASLKFRDS